MHTIRDERYEDWLAGLVELPIATADLKGVWDAAWDSALAAVLAQAPTEDAARDAFAAWRDTAATVPGTGQPRDWTMLDDRDKTVWYSIAARAISGAVHSVRERPESVA